MAYKLMIQGTMSSAGKSFIVTALCRMFRNMGYKVCPFKSQNMALNSFVTEDGFEIGRAQAAQAEAAGIKPDVRINPVLLKPTSDVGSQVIVMGKPVGNMKAAEYYNYKTSLIPVIKKAFHELEKEYDVIIVEGAGSPAEINLKENDIVNMGLAKMLDLPVILAGDINLGGVFAQLLGTVEWLDDEEKDRIKGVIINKFRGDVNLLMPGIEMLEERINRKVIGVIPYSDAKIDEEDSVTSDKRKSIDNDKKDIAVIHLPHISNFTDFAPFEMCNDVCVRYVNESSELGIPDLIILPGTKNTIADLKWIKKSGLFEAIDALKERVPIMGICGGYQMLGISVDDPLHIEGGNRQEGFGYINVKTTFSEEKVLRQTEGIIQGNEGFFACLNETRYSGYEIHCGETISESESEEKYCTENVFGTYIHGIFDNKEVLNGIVCGLHKNKNCKEIEINYSEYKDSQYEKAAELIENSIDLDLLFSIMGINKINV